MAEVAKSGVPSLATIEPGYEHQINGLRAGETLAEGDFVYIKASDNRVYKATGAAANEAARVRGVVMMQAVAGDGVTILHGVVVRWGAALSPGAPYYISATVPGQLDSAATTGGTTPAAVALDATRLLIKHGASA